MEADLRRALDLKNNDTVAIIGAGGKTSAMFLMASGYPLAVISTSTHLLGDQHELADNHVILDPGEEISVEMFQAKLGTFLITGALDEAKFRYLPPTDLQLFEIHQTTKKIDLPFFIEADGARHRSIKAPGPHEPAIPSYVDVVVNVAGASVFGKALTEEVAHRPKIFAWLGEIALGQPITPLSFINVCNHQMGGLKNIPSLARRHLLLTQADNANAINSAREVADGVMGDWDSVVIAAIKSSPGKVISVRRSVSGIILAAGRSTRYGKNKIYDQYNQKTFLRTVCETAIRVFDEIVVVLADGDEIGPKELADLPVKLVINEQVDEGQSASIKIGLAAVRRHTGAAIFLHVDQPQTHERLLRTLIERGQQTNAPIIAPLIQDKRGTPVYFGQNTFADLKTIEGDSGGRQIFHKYSLEYVPWLDEKQLIDIDTPDDLRKLLGKMDEE